MGSTPVLASFVLLAFAANSVLCRLALFQTAIDPASFMAIRLLSGAVTMGVLVRLRNRDRSLGGDWQAALTLLVYAVTFTFAYVSVTTGTGALLLFGAVQVIMIAAGLRGGERVDWWVASGWLLAVAGLVYLLLPGIAAPPLGAGAMMLCAGIAWGAYSLHGRRSADPLRDTAGNFIRTAPFALLLMAILWRHVSIDRRGAVLAMLSGAIASGLGYAAWYTVLPRLRAITAANLQLSIPVIAAFGGLALSRESISPRLMLCSALVLGGTALATRRRQDSGRG